MHVQTYLQHNLRISSIRFMFLKNELFNILYIFSIFPQSIHIITRIFGPSFPSHLQYLPSSSSAPLDFFSTGCSLNIVYFSKNFRKVATSPSPELGCYWLYKKSVMYRDVGEGGVAVNCENFS